MMRGWESPWKKYSEVLLKVINDAAKAISGAWAWYLGRLAPTIVVDDLEEVCRK